MTTDLVVQKIGVDWSTAPDTGVTVYRIGGKTVAVLDSDGFQEEGPDRLFRYIGRRRLRAFLRLAMPMTSRMWKNRWQRATVSIRVGPSFLSRRQELIEFIEQLETDPEYQRRLEKAVEDLGKGSPARLMRGGRKVHWSQDYSDARYAKRRR